MAAVHKLPHSDKPVAEMAPQRPKTQGDAAYVREVTQLYNEGKRYIACMLHNQVLLVDGTREEENEAYRAHCEESPDHE